LAATVGDYQTHPQSEWSLWNSASVASFTIGLAGDSIVISTPIAPYSRSIAPQIASVME